MTPSGASHPSMLQRRPVARKTFASQYRLKNRGGQISQLTVTASPRQGMFEDFGAGFNGLLQPELLARCQQCE